MALDTVEKLLKQADRLTPNEQLLLASRLIERVRQANKPLTGKEMLKSGLVGMWAKRKDIDGSLRGKYKGKGLMKALMADKKQEKEY
jgi:hypothetical protein